MLSPLQPYRPPKAQKEAAKPLKNKQGHKAKSVPGHVFVVAKATQLFRAFILTPKSGSCTKRGQIIFSQFKSFDSLWVRKRTNPQNPLRKKRGFLWQPSPKTCIVLKHCKKLRHLYFEWWVVNRSNYVRYYLVLTGWIWILDMVLCMNFLVFFNNICQKSKAVADIFM